MKIAIAVLSLALAAGACQETKRQAADSVQIPSAPTPNAAPVNANADKSKIRLFDGSGAVTRINLELGSVELKHKEIKGLMPAMTMEFYVSDRKQLDNLKIGDQVDFVLEDNAGVEKIVSLRKK